jgi:hypothetical protein
MPHSNRQQTFVILALIFVFTMWWMTMFARIRVDAHHDGIIFVPAVEILRGKVLFRQTVDQYGALTTLVQASFLSLFGQYVIVLNGSAILFYAISITFRLCQ